VTASFIDSLSDPIIGKGLPGSLSLVLRRWLKTQGGDEGKMLELLSFLRYSCKVIIVVKVLN
jgi:hypothetical protein